MNRTKLAGVGLGLALQNGRTVFGSAR